MILSEKKLEPFLDQRKLEQYLGTHTKYLPTASFLFVTYNRCPYKEFDRNPLTWAIKSLNIGRFNPISEIVVVDDCSDDYTEKNIDWLKTNTKIEIRYFKLEKKKECSSARRFGIKQVKSNLVFMGDDDCLYSEYFAAAASLTYQFLKEHRSGEKIAVLNLPVYEKMFRPIEAISRSLVGKVNLQETFFYHEFGKFIEEYIQFPEYMDDTGLLFPLRVDTFAGVNLCDRDSVMDSGNYPDLSMWPYGYSEHIELSHSLTKRGYAIYHQSDPKAGCLHLKYGGKSRDHFLWPPPDSRVEGLKYSLKQMIKMARAHLPNTGARVSSETFHFVEIGSFFSFYLKISPELALKFAKREYDAFVNKNEVFSTTPVEKISSKMDRHDLFVEALEVGLKASRQQVGRDYSSFEERLSKIFNF